MIRPAAFVLLGLLVAAHPTMAQSLSFTTKDGKDPITVTAQQGLEWQQNEKRFIARGSAKAQQGDISVVAEELTAYYREKVSYASAPAPEGGAVSGDSTQDSINSSEVYRVDAIGDVTITSASDVATGGAAVYDFDKGVLVLEGSPVTLTTADGKVTAHKTLQYWSKEKIAVAEGDAVAVDSNTELGRRLKADKLTAYFRESDAPSKGKDKGKEKRDITHILGAGNVVLTTKAEVVRGDRATYNLDSGMAVVDGAVKMTRDNSQLNGGYAVVNVNSGISRLYGSAAEAKGQGVGAPTRVRALLAPTPRAASDKTPLPKE